MVALGVIAGNGESPEVVKELPARWGWVWPSDESEGKRVRDREIEEGEREIGRESETLRERKRNIGGRRRI